MSKGGHGMDRRRWLAAVVVAASTLMGACVPLHAAPLQPGQIFVAYGGSNIGVFADTVSLAGTPTMAPLSIDPSSFTTATSLSGGGGVALDESGNLYVTVQNFKGTANQRGLIKIDRNGNVVLKIGATTIDFRGIAVHDGVIYVASESGIRRFNANTGESISPILASGTAFRDVAFDAQGNLYALKSTEVIKWAAGSFSGSGTKLFDIPDEDPRALVLDERGDIYITFEDTKSVRRYSQSGVPLATYVTPPGTGSLIGLDYDPGTRRLFASHTGTKIGQILWINRNASSGATMSAFGPTNLSGVRWLAVYPTPEPAAGLLLLASLMWLLKRCPRKCGGSGKQ